jgi:hypothetical protein
MTPAEHTAAKVRAIFEALGRTPETRQQGEGLAVSCDRCDVWIEPDGAIAAVLRCGEALTLAT